MNKGGVVARYGVAATTTIVIDTIVAVNATGYLVPATDTAGLTVVGQSEQNVDNSAGANGDKDCDVLAGAIVDLATSGLGLTDMTHTAYILNATTLTTQGGTVNAIPGGILLWIDTVNDRGLLRF